MTSQMDEMTTGETPTTAEGNSMADVIMSMTSQIPNMVTTMLTDRWVSLGYQLAITAYMKIPATPEKYTIRSVGRVLIGDFRTLYNHVILDHRQCPLFIFPNDRDGPMIYKYSKNRHLWTLVQCKFWTFHFPPLEPMYCPEA